MSINRKNEFNHESKYFIEDACPLDLDLDKDIAKD
jgi:hypothetical protein